MIKARAKRARTVEAKQEKTDATIEKMDARMERGFGAVAKDMERGFGAVADDIADIRREMATKEQIIAPHTQVNSIETELRDTKRHKLVTRVADLEEKVFGEARA